MTRTGVPLKKSDLWTPVRYPVTFTSDGLPRPQTDSTTSVRTSFRVYLSSSLASLRCRRRHRIDLCQPSHLAPPTWDFVYWPLVVTDASTPIHWYITDSLQPSTNLFDSTRLPSRKYMGKGICNSWIPPSVTWPLAPSLVLPVRPRERSVNVLRRNPSVEIFFEFEVTHCRSVRLTLYTWVPVPSTHK